MNEWMNERMNKWMMNEWVWRYGKARYQEMHTPENERPIAHRTLYGKNVTARINDFFNVFKVTLHSSL